MNCYLKREELLLELEDVTAELDLAVVFLASVEELAVDCLSCAFLIGFIRLTLLVQSRRYQHPFLN